MLKLLKWKSTYTESLECRWSLITNSPIVTPSMVPSGLKKMEEFRIENRRYSLRGEYVLQFLREVWNGELLRFTELVWFYLAGKKYIFCTWLFQCSLVNILEQNRTWFSKDRPHNCFGEVFLPFTLPQSSLKTYLFTLCYLVIAWKAEWLLFICTAFNQHPKILSHNHSIFPVSSSLPTS